MTRATPPPEKEREEEVLKLLQGKNVILERFLKATINLREALERKENAKGLEKWIRLREDEMAQISALDKAIASRRDCFDTQSRALLAARESTREKLSAIAEEDDRCRLLAEAVSRDMQNVLVQGNQDARRRKQYRKPAGHAAGSTPRFLDIKT